jgi:hypothetical protein
MAAVSGMPLPKSEIEHDSDQNVHWLAAETPGRELPLAHGYESLFVQAAGIERANDPKVGWAAVCADDELEHDRALNFLKKSGRRVGRFDLSDDARRRDGTARAIDTAPYPAS